MASTDGVLALAREAYGEALVAVHELAHALTAEDLDLPTDCPGWSVRDHVAHVSGLEAIIYGFPQPAHAPDWAALPHVRNDAGRFMEVDVDLRRRRSAISRRKRWPVPCWCLWCWAGR